METIQGILLSIIDHIEFEENSIKDARKEVRTKLSKVGKAVKVNEELGITTDLSEIEKGLTGQLETTKENLRVLKLVKYRMNSALDIINGKEVEEVE